MIRYRLRSMMKGGYLRFRAWILTLVSLFLPGRSPVCVPSVPGRILVIAQPRLGDAVLSLPTLFALRDHYPDTQIILLSPPAVKGLFELTPAVDRVMVHPRGNTLLGIGNFLRSIREQKIDLLIDLNTDGSLFPAWIARLSGARYSVGYGQDGRGVFFDQIVSGPDEEKHTIDRLLALLAPLRVGNPSPEVRLSLPENGGTFFPPEDQAGEGEREIPLVGIHPGGTHWTQRWPVEYFAELADELILSGSARVILCGGPSDWETIRQVQERMRAVPEVAPPFPSLRDFAVFLSHLDLLVCNNSGPLHLACAVGTKTFSFMGPTKAAQWWPKGEGHTVFRRDDLPCIGCGRGYCRMKNHDCMRGILPGELFQAVGKELSRRERQGRREEEDQKHITTEHTENAEKNKNLFDRINRMDRIRSKT